MSTLSNLLREARLAKGWTQVELARQSGVPLPSVNRYENPKFTGQPRRDNIMDIAHVLGIPDDKILPVIGFPIRSSASAEERQQRYVDVAALAANDPRFNRVAELWDRSDDDERDRMLSIIESAFGLAPRPVRRQRRARQQNGSRQ